MLVITHVLVAPNSQHSVVRGKARRAGKKLDRKKHYLRKLVKFGLLSDGRLRGKATAPKVAASIPEYGRSITLNISWASARHHMSGRCAP